MAKTILYYIDSQIFGGAEQALLRLIQGLDRHLWTPLLAYHPAPGLEAFLQAARQYDVCLLPAHEMPLGVEGARRIPEFVQLIRREHPDVFHAHLSWPLGCKWGLAAAVAARVPAVVATEQLYVEMDYTPAARLQQRLLASGVGCYLAVSHTLARKLSELFHIPAWKIRVIPNVAPPEFFSIHRSRPLQPFTHYPDRPVILTVARLNAQKGHNDLLQAAVLVPNAIFVLVGDGPERLRLEEQARALRIDDRVVFAGYQADISPWLAGCDLFVLPSLYEGLPLSLVEAAAAGKPVIATNIPGNNEAVLHGETGWLVPPRDPQALAAAIRSLLADPDLRHKLGQAGQERARREYSLENHVYQVTQVYEDLLER